MRVPFAAPVTRPETLPTGVSLVRVAFCLIAVLAVAAGSSHAQAPAATGTMGAGPARAASVPARPSSAAGAASRAARSSTSPLWSELTAPQQQALAPLAAIWPTISEAQKRKWVVISKSYGRLPPSEQVKLHSRMTEWVALSPQQRIQARLNFAESKQLSADDKKAKWEEYQALPPEEKRKLAAGAASAAKPPATAAAVKPAPTRKLAAGPRAGDSKPPRIAAAPNQVDHNTLLPQPVPPTTPAPSN
jgi:hypothetical protein